MERQLVLVDTKQRPFGTIDERTRQIGLRGVAAARAALREAAQRAELLHAKQAA